MRRYLDSAAGLAGRCEVKTVAFDGAAGSGAVGTVALFTVTGAVHIRLVCICTENLAEAGATATIEVGIAGATTAFIAQVNAVEIDAGEIWHDGTPDSGNELWTVTATTAERVLANGQDIIATVGSQNVTDGTLVFSAFWTPLTADALVVAA